MSLLKEFREFAVKGNAVDMAVGIIVGAAFGGVVNSIVNDVVMPPIGVILGGIDFKNLQWVLKPAVLDQVTNAVVRPATAIRYGAFVNTLVNFVIIAFCVFLLVKLINVARRGLEGEHKS